MYINRPEIPDVELTLQYFTNLLQATKTWALARQIGEATNRLIFNTTQK